MKNIVLEREQESVSIFIDIETIPSGDPIDPNTLTPPGNLKKKDTIEAWQAFDAPRLAEELYRKRSLNSMEGKIICVGCAIGDDKATTWGDDGDVNEKDILKLMVDDIQLSLPSPFASIVWIAHNGIGFDFKWLKRKAIKYQLPWLAQSIRPERYGGNCIDTIQLWQCGDYKDAYCKLSAIADFLGIPYSTDVDGSMVYDMFLAGKIAEICEYCRRDVELVRAVYRKIMFLEE